MARSGKIIIRDARTKNMRGFRVLSIAKNGEILQFSQVIDSVANVEKHVLAMFDLYNTLVAEELSIQDHTKRGIFFERGSAKKWVQKMA